MRFSSRSLAHTTRRSRVAVRFERLSRSRNCIPGPSDRGRETRRSTRCRTPRRRTRALVWITAIRRRERAGDETSTARTFPERENTIRSAARTAVGHSTTFIWLGGVRSKRGSHRQSDGCELAVSDTASTAVVDSRRSRPLPLVRLIGIDAERSRNITEYYRNELQKFIGQVQHRLEYGQFGHAVRTTRAVLTTLGERIQEGEATDLASPSRWRSIAI